MRTKARANKQTTSLGQKKFRTYKPRLVKARLNLHAGANVKERERKVVYRRLRYDDTHSSAGQPPIELRSKALLRYFTKRQNEHEPPVLNVLQVLRRGVVPLRSWQYTRARWCMHESSPPHTMLLSMIPSSDVDML
jgi:hypothetical protein